MPPGFIYIRWETRPGSANAYGESLVIWFGKHGRKIEWTVENSQDPQASGYRDCTQHIHFSGPRTKVFRFGAKIVYYGSGAVGQDAVVCLPNHQSLWVWNDYSITPQTLAKVAASARPIG